MNVIESVGAARNPVELVAFLAGVSPFSTKYAQRFYAAAMSEFRQWFKSLFGHLSVLGGTVALIYLVDSLTNRSAQVGVTWLILLGCLLYASFLRWRDEHRNAEKLKADQDEQAKGVLDKAFELLKRPESQMQPFQGLYAAGAADLKTNEQVVWVADKISEHHEHPMRWMQKYVPEEEWLSFLQWGKHHPDFNFEKGGDYLKGLVQWAVKHNRGTEESIAKEIYTGMVDQGSKAITSSRPR